MSLHSPIHLTFAPLANFRQVLLAKALLCVPWKHRRGDSGDCFRAEIEKDLGGHAFLFSSGREALLAYLRAIGLKPGEEVIVQALTCVVVPNAVHAAGGRPVYADIDPETLNLTAASVASLLSPRTRAVICQHTFGIPGPLRDLRTLCTAKGILLIEDCAHTVPDCREPRGIATTGDAVLFSFGRDKAISGVSGGAMLLQSPEHLKSMRAFERGSIDLPRWIIFRLLLYPLLYTFAKPFYGLGVGKVFLAVMGRLQVLVPIVQPEEKGGDMSPILHRMPNALACLALDQWKRRKSLNDRRRAMTRATWEALAEYGLLHAEGGPLRVPQAILPHLPLQKFPVFVKNAEAIRQALKRKNIHLHDGWTGCVICPGSVDQESLDYQLGSDPQAEECSLSLLSFPTHPTMSQRQIRRLMHELRTLLPIDN